MSRGAIEREEIIIFCEIKNRKSLKRKKEKAKRRDVRKLLRLRNGLRKQRRRNLFNPP
jgi:hypothetical protein